MSEVLNGDQEKLLKLAVRNLARVSAALPEGDDKQAVGDLVWDLSCLFSNEIRSNDARSLEDIQTSLYDTGRERLQKLEDAVPGQNETYLLKEARALLTVAKLIDNKTPERGEERSWQKRIREEPVSQRELG